MLRDDIKKKDEHTQRIVSRVCKRYFGRRMLRVGVGFSSNSIILPSFVGRKLLISIIPEERKPYTRIWIPRLAVGSKIGELRMTRIFPAYRKSVDKKKVASTLRKVEKLEIKRLREKTRAIKKKAALKYASSKQKAVKRVKKK